MERQRILQIKLDHNGTDFFDNLAAIIV